MKKLLCMVALALVACHDNEPVKAGDRKDIGNMVTPNAPLAAESPSPESLLSKESVRKVQTALSERGFTLEKSGVMDARTQTALRSFQQREGLAPTGMPDQLTLQKLQLDPKDILHPRPVPQDDQIIEQYDSQTH